MVFVEIIMKLNEGFQPLFVVTGMILISSFISYLLCIYIQILLQKYDNFMKNATLFLYFYKNWFIIDQLRGYLCTFAS